MRIVPTLIIVAGVLIAQSGCQRGAAPATQSAKSSNAESGRTTSPDQGSTTDRNDVSGDDVAAADEQRAQAALAKTGDKRPVLVCFGDSLTAGWGTGPGQSYPDYLQTDLDARGYGYRVVNQGISGNTTKDGVARLNDVLRLKPQIAVVEFGGNDGLRGLPIEATHSNLDQIVGTLKHDGVKVALAGITLPPDYGENYIHQFDAMYTEIARKNGVPMLPFLLQNVYGVPGMMQRDQTHATANGNEIVARNVLGLVRPLLKKKEVQAR